MITLLVVSPDRDRLAAALAAGSSAVEVMLAGSAEEAAEKLARNRRIDGVLLMPFAGAEEALAAIREELSPPPPIFRPGPPAEAAGIVALEPADLPGLLEQVVRHLRA